MPRVTPVTPALRALLTAQDGVVHVGQLERHAFSRDAARSRVRCGAWQRLLPGVLLTVSGEPTRRQRLVAAVLWAGPGAAVDGVDACDWYGVRPAGFSSGLVHVVVPFGRPARTASFVVVRRSVGEINIGSRGLVPYVDAATAFVVAARTARTDRQAIATLSRGLQEGLVTTHDLARAREAIGDKWCRGVDSALVAVGVGLRSPAERDTRDLVLSSRALPEPLWNQWLDLGDGGPPICSDALWIEAGMMHETNGRQYHAWGLAFEDMQRRHDRATAAGLIALHNSPSRIRRAGPAVLRELEQTYARYAGRGLPSGVVLLDPPTNCG